MKKSSIEIAVGVFILIGILCVAYLTIRLGKMELLGGNYYTLNARFQSVSGLKSGAQVEMAGVQVGQVDSIHLDPVQQVAVVTLKVNKSLSLTDDVIASIKTSGLIGDKVTIPGYQTLFKGDILHGKLRNGRQFWAQYLGDRTVPNSQTTPTTFEMQKVPDISGSTWLQAVCIYEDQIQQPYINVFPYQGFQIDFTNLDGSRIGVPFDCPVDRLSFIIRGTGKVIGVTVNGF